VFKEEMLEPLSEVVLAVSQAQQVDAVQQAHQMLMIGERFKDAMRKV